MTSAANTPVEQRSSWLKYLLLIVAALASAVPLIVMLLTSVKTLPDVQSGSLLALPHSFTLEPWLKAWNSACAGLTCGGVQVGFWNSVKITVPGVVVTIALGSISGYALALWRPRWNGLLLMLLSLAIFMPYQVVVFPLVKMWSTANIFGTLFGVVLVHVVFNLPLITVLFRNFYVAVPGEIVKAARVDGAGFYSTFFEVILPMSVAPIIVSVILVFTNIWNDFLFGLIFAGPTGRPMTVELNNIVGAVTGEREYNVDMAATLITALPPLLIYFLSGRYFVRGLASGAVKG